MPLLNFNFDQQLKLMKTLTKFVGATILLLAPALLSGQQPEVATTTRSNVIKLNLISPLVRTGSFFYERAVSDYSSVQLGFFYTGASIGDTQIRGIGITPEYRFYLSERHKAPRGAFVAPYLRYQNLTITNDDPLILAEASGNFFGGGLLVGVQTVLRNRISMEAFAGPSYSSVNMKIITGDGDNLDTDALDGFGIRAGVTIGIVF